MNMIEVKTAELSGAALDWAVCFIEVKDLEGKRMSPDLQKLVMDAFSPPYSPSTSWEQAGRLIEKYRLEIVYDGGRHEGWRCVKDWCYGEVNDTYPLGETHLIAACRAIVAAKLGDTVQIPAELLS